MNMFIDKLNKLGSKREPFLFLIDFNNEKPRIWLENQINNQEVLFDIEGNFSNSLKHSSNKVSIIEKDPISYSEYKKKFDKITQHIHQGDTFLINLTSKTQIVLDNSLENLFYYCRAKFKLYVPNELVIFSPEPFVFTSNNKIYSTPMKGTIDDSIPNARDILLHDKKELFEHFTITDLIRNDLAIVSKNITVEKFRYLEEIETENKKLLQTSSIISGELSENWQNKIGTKIFSLLPAGSITGAPKKRTTQIIKNVENYNRNYYCGIFGYFDGTNLHSAVNIRFISKDKGRYYYYSGGGITSNSNARDEYKEMIQKIYVPIR